MRSRSGTFIISKKSEKICPPPGGATPRICGSPPKVEEWKKPGEEIVMEVRPRRRMWQCGGSGIAPLEDGGDVLRELREDLADNGSVESQLKMASELVEDMSVEEMDPEEVAYREEQSLFWLSKAAERGSLEAKSRIRRMADSHSKGINSNNVLSLKEILNSASDTEENLSGRRIGKTLFRSLSSDRIKSPTVFTSNLLKGREVDWLNCTKDDELQCSDLMTLGREYMNGHILSDFDTKLIRAESNQSLITSLLEKYTLIQYSMSRLLAEYILAGALFKVIILLLIYQYWIFVSVIAAAEVAAVGLFLYSVAGVAHRPLEKRRFEAWSQIWMRIPSKSSLSAKEHSLAHKNFTRTRNLRFLLTAMFSIGVLEFCEGSLEILTLMTRILIPASVFLISKSKCAIISYGCLLGAYYMDISVKSNYELLVTFEIAAAVVFASLVLFLWYRLGIDVLPHLLCLKVINYLFIPELNSLSTLFAFGISAYYSLRKPRYRHGKLCGALISALIVVVVAHRVSIYEDSSNVISDLSLREYARACPSKFECPDFEGLSINWTNLEVVSVNQRRILHPLNSLISKLPSPLRRYSLNHWDLRYCDIGVVDTKIEDSSVVSGEGVSEDEGYSSFIFGSFEPKKNRERKIVVARSKSEEICRQISIGDVINVIGRTYPRSSEKEGPDVIVDYI